MSSSLVQTLDVSSLSSSAKATFSAIKASNSSRSTALTTTGMKACFIPHSSVHAPLKIPGSGTFVQAVLIKPGIASCLTAKSGTHQECMTSFPVIKNLTLVLVGITRGSSTSRK